MSAPGAPARQGAAALLQGVIASRTSLSDQIDAASGPLAKLAPGERARAQSLATTTLRHLGRIDATLGRFLKKPPPAPALNALRLAAAELLIDGVAAHAAVDGAVRLVRSDRKVQGHSGLVNAVARRLATEGAAIWAETPEAEMPEWLAEPLAAEWGVEVLRRIEAVHAVDAPPLDLTPRDPSETTELATALKADVLPSGSMRLSRPGRVTGLPGFESGAWWVQDAAAAMLARLFDGDLRGLRALDLCAAPGGKTLQLAAAGADVTALDVSKARLTRLRENLTRTGLKAKIVTADARRWTAPEPFDLVLLDAPCSATGTMRRHPDLPHLRSGADLPGLIALQAELLESAWDLLAEGARLVYCACSLLPAEGEAQIAAFLDRRDDAEQLRPDAVDLGLEPGWIDAQAGVRLRPDYWADRGGMDGFYAALLQKRVRTA